MAAHFVSHTMWLRRRRWITRSGYLSAQAPA
jgi:hypothetical protein